MSIIRKLFVIGLLALMLASVSSASATGSTTTRQVINNPVSWSMTPAQCPNIKVLLSGSGQLNEVITTTTYANGKVHIVDDALVVGRASDVTGHYRFIYANHFVQDIPAGSGPVQAFMIDSFTLSGSGSAHLSNGFVWKWSFTQGAPNFPPEFNFQNILTYGNPISVTGEAHCDPL